MLMDHALDTCTAVYVYFISSNLSGKSQNLQNSIDFMLQMSTLYFCKLKA